MRQRFLPDTPALSLPPPLSATTSSHAIPLSGVCPRCLMPPTAQGSSLADPSADVGHRSLDASLVLHACGDTAVKDAMFDLDDEGPCDDLSCPA